MPLSPSFLAMLKARPQWLAYTGDDPFGNNLFAAPVTIEAYVGTLTAQPGTQDGQNQQDTEQIARVDLITDYKGIKPKDKLLLQTGTVVHVESTEVLHDALGAPMLQNVVAITTERG